MALSFLVLFVVFYFFMIRPEGKRKKEQQRMQSNLAVGDQVTTVGGVVGTVCNVTKETVTIETGADRVRIQFVRGAVQNKGIVQPPQK
jgi:preprotein translocase subunit YajC